MTRGDELLERNSKISKPNRNDKLLDKMQAAQRNVERTMMEKRYRIDLLLVASTWGASKAELKIMAVIFFEENA